MARKKKNAQAKPTEETPADAPADETADASEAGAADASPKRAAKCAISVREANDAEFVNSFGGAYVAECATHKLTTAQRSSEERALRELEQLHH